MEEREEILKRALLITEKLDGLAGLPPLHTDRIDLSSKIRVEVAQDGMTVYFSPSSELKGNEHAVAEYVKEYLKQVGVKRGIMQNAITWAASDPKGQRTVIARGMPPKRGRDGSWKVLVETEEHQKPLVGVNGRVDHHNIRNIANIMPGDLLAVYSPPTPGTPGYNVFGKVLPPTPGRDRPAPLGKNVELSENGKHIRATGRGHLVITNRGTINVMPILNISGDVGLESGNIDFVGTVCISGGIRSGFVVKAGGDLTVGGNIDAALVTAAGGITVRGGIQGRDRGRVEAGGDLVCRYIENGTVSAGGNIKTAAIMHSFVSAAGTVEVEGRKGLIVGGRVLAGELVAAKTVGAHLATSTVVEIGFDPKRREYMQELEQKLAATQAKLTEAKKGFARLKRQGARKQELLVKIEDLVLLLTRREEELREEYEGLKQEFDAALNGRLVVSGVIYPGVQVTIGKMVTVIKEERKNCVIEIGGEGELVIK